MSRRLLAELLAARLDAEPDFEVLTVVGEPEALVRVVHRYRPDVLVLAPQMIQGEVAALADQLRAASPATRVVYVGGPTGRQVFVDAVAAGWSAFVRSDESVGDLLEAVRGAAQGRPHLDEELIGQLVGRPERVGVPGRPQLTAREREVLRLMSEGQTPAEIAAELGRSVNTVRHHVQRILDKLGVHTQLAAVTYAAREGLVTRPDL